MCALKEALKRVWNVNGSFHEQSMRAQDIETLSPVDSGHGQCGLKK
jgi:hypothetical protein